MSSSFGKKEVSEAAFSLVFHYISMLISSWAEWSWYIVLPKGNPTVLFPVKFRFTPQTMCPASVMYFQIAYI